jgi:uncharacterized membrane protein
MMRWAIALCLSLFVLIRFWDLTEDCLWFDEIFSLHAASMGYLELLRFIAADLIHPPFFYILLKIWITTFGDSTQSVRLFSLLFSTAAIFPVIKICRLQGMKNGELYLALFLLSVNGYFIHYSQTVRMYSLLIFLSTLSIYLFLLHIKNPEKKLTVCLVIVNLLLVYTHYYGLLVLFTQIVIAMFERRKRLLLSSIFVLLCFLPWILTIRALAAGQGVAQNIGWITRPGAGTVLRFFVTLNQPFYFMEGVGNRVPIIHLIAFSLLFGLPLIYLAYYRRQEIRHLLAFTLVPPIIAFLVSHLLPHSIWGTRHLVIILVPYTLLVSMAIFSLRWVTVKTTVLVLLGCWISVSLALYSTRQQVSYIWCAWDEIAAKLEASPDQIFAFEDLVAYHLWFSLRGSDTRTVSVLKGVPGVLEDSAYFLPRGFNGIRTLDLALLNLDQFWLVFRDRDWNLSREPLSLFIEKGYEIRKWVEIRKEGGTAFAARLSRREPISLNSDRR